MFSPAYSSTRLAQSSSVLKMSFFYQAKRFAEDADNAIWTNQVVSCNPNEFQNAVLSINKTSVLFVQQFDNTANRRAHVETTGPEIWQQTDGKVDAITFSTGTGGTLAGRQMWCENLTAFFGLSCPLNCYCKQETS